MCIYIYYQKPHIHLSLSLPLSLSLSLYIYMYTWYTRIKKMYRRLGEGAWPTQPGNRFVFFNCACVRAVLVKSFRSKNVPVTPCIFYLSLREVVSCILCDLGFCGNSQGLCVDFSRVPVSYLWVWMSSQCSPVSLISREFKLRHIEFSVSSCDFNEFWWVQARSQWVPMSSQWVLVNSCKFYRAPVRSIEF